MIGIRGATTLDASAAGDPSAVLEATRELLLALADANALAPDRIVSAIFTCTPDLQTAFPAEAARAIGWTDVPLLCAVEINVPGALARCIRVLLHVDSDGAASARHVYLRAAQELRPDFHYE